MAKVLWEKEELIKAFNYEQLDLTIPITGASIDTRTIRCGEMFFALSGENFNGNHFIDDAFSKGASLCFSDDIDKVSKANRSKVMKVENVAKSLNFLAKYRRDSLSGKVIGITGSVGKTSTKEMMKLVLSSFGKTFASMKNFNNHFGLPLSLINCPKDTQFCILELGMSSKGEISNLVKIANPDISIITNVNPVHLEFFDSTLGIAYAKSEIFESNRKHKYAILNKNSLHYDVQLKQALSKGLEIFTFGKDDKANCYIKEISTLSKVKKVTIVCFGKEYSAIFDQTVGDHLIYNSLITFLTAKILGLDLSLIGEKLTDFSPQLGRGEILNLSHNIKLVDESYNSSPEALSSAITNVISLKSKEARVIAVLGDMKELGKEEINYHKNIRVKGVDKLFCVGELMKNLYNNVPSIIRKEWSKDALEMSKIINDYIKPNDIILVKGSFSMKMKLIIDSIKEKFKDE